MIKTTRLVGISVSMKAAGQAAIVSALCALMVGQPVLAEAAVSKVPKHAVAAAGQIPASERTLHALNRLTFGPRPGDVAAVQVMGLSKWFEQQLNPKSIDDSALDARLQNYPATMMPLDAMLRKYPSPQTLRRIGEGSVALPSDPLERAMVTDQLAFYSMARKKREQAGAADAVGATGDPTMLGGASAMTPGAGAAALSPAGKGGKRKQQDAQVGMAAQGTAGAGDGMMVADMPLPSAAASIEPGVPVPAGQQISQDRIQSLLALSPDQRLTAILAMPATDLLRLRGSLRGADKGRLTEGMTPLQKETLMGLQGSIRMVELESMESRLERDIYSERQLEAVMTDFWLNHFNVYARKNQNEPYLLPSYERETVRPHALGKFEDLLVATAESPAMLQYLDNFRSVGPDSLQATRLKRAQQLRPDAPGLKQASAGLNENYGRELMELHTLGVNGGYSQADVTMVSKVFTGWTLDKPYAGGGGFQFDEKKHEPGAKTVLGRTINEGGQREGLEVLHLLATSPATAHFISEKLAVRFVSDTPPATLVDKMAASFLQSDGDIKTVLRTMFNAPEFWSTDVYRAKVKTPLEFVVSAVRASDLQVTNSQALVAALDKLGMPLYGMQTPNGYSWKQDGWVSTGALVSRMNFSLVMSDDRIPGTQTGWAKLLGEPIPAAAGAIVPAAYVAGETPELKEKRLEILLLGQPVSDRTRATVLAQSLDGSMTAQAAAQFNLGADGGGKGAVAARGLQRQQQQRRGQGRNDDQQAAAMAGLLLGSPEFQRR